MFTLVRGDGDKTPAAPLFAPLSLAHEHENAAVALSEAERIIQQQEERIRQLESLALTDELTGLINRRGFFMALQRELAMAGRDLAAGGVVAMVDLDGFKAINDRWGHGAGDEYLRYFARALRKCVRPSDVVARLGGDEFAILFTRMRADTGGRRIARIEKTLEEKRFSWNGTFLPLRASFGCSPFVAADAPETILAAADRMLYARKAERRKSGAVGFIHPLDRY